MLFGRMLFLSNQFATAMDHFRQGRITFVEIQLVKVIIQYFLKAYALTTHS